MANSREFCATHHSKCFAVTTALNVFVSARTQKHAVALLNEEASSNRETVFHFERGADDVSKWERYADAS